MKKLFNVLAFIQGAVILSFGILVYLLLMSHKEYSQSEDRLFRSYLLADELRQSSDDLTRLARTYVVTGDPKFESEYWAVLDTRNGKRPRLNGESVSLHDLMVREGFTSEELDKLELSRTNSDRLVNTEAIAMAAVKKLNKPLAIKLMHDQAYHEEKAKITRPIDEFYTMFTRRTANEVAKHERHSRLLVFALGGMVIVALIILAASFVLMRRQIFQQELAEAELVEAKQNAEAANRSKDVFLATLSHELRTPLTAITAWIQLIRAGRLNPEKMQRAFRTIEDAAKNQNQLISDLLDISKITSGKLTLDLQETNLTEVIVKAVNAVTLSAEKKAIEITVNISADPVFLVGDPIRLQQVIWNLLTNAVKFTPEKGKIEISLDVNEDLWKAQLVVRDSGKGIPKNYLPHLFEMFSQEDSSTMRAYGGLGIGLALVRSIVEAHGGQVQAASEGEGKGSQFTITLPLSERSRYLTEPSEFRPTILSMSEPNLQHALAGLKILIVDDDRATLCSIGEILKSFEAHLMKASSMSEALNHFCTEKPDVIISDIAMPMHSGLELIEAIRSLPNQRDRQTPAIALTAHADIQSRERVLASGFQAFLTKPVDASHLISTILALTKNQDAENWQAPV